MKDTNINQSIPEFKWIVMDINEYISSFFLILENINLQTQIHFN